tara:strand:- start:144 stop:500 length:357 start_codon:yes stop_codon:yes gene_type:complete
MATPNIASIATLSGVTIAGAATTSPVDILDVTLEHTYKVNTIVIANIDGTNSADITLEISVDNGVSYFAFAKTIAVPADSSLSILDTPLYFDETDLLRITASANSDLTYVVSYEDILD